MDLEDGATVQILGNIRGGMGKKSKNKTKNHWESDDASGSRSGLAEEQCEEPDLEMAMEKHRTLGSAHIDVLAEMDTEAARAVDEVS